MVASAKEVNADFEVLEVEGEKLLVRDANGLLYLAGQESICPNCHLAIHRAQARLGLPIVTVTKELKWQEEEMGAVVGNAGVAGGWWSVVGNTTVVGGQWLVVGKYTPSSPATDPRQPATGHRPPITCSPPPTTCLAKTLPPPVYKRSAI